MCYTRKAGVLEGSSEDKDSCSRACASICAITIYFLLMIFLLVFGIIELVHGKTSGIILISIVAAIFGIMCLFFAACFCCDLGYCIPPGDVSEQFIVDENRKKWKRRFGIPV